ncbi:MAG: SPOR domain-containing protein [Pseudomonadota bacterium]
MIVTIARNMRRAKRPGLRALMMGITALTAAISVASFDPDGAAAQTDLRFSDADRREGLRDGVRFYQQGDYAAALKLWLPLADEENPNALFNLGQLYRLGRGVVPDQGRAIHYYRRAAKLGHVWAMGNLGTMLYFSEEPTRKREEAIEWWQRAAENGDNRAQYMLGIAHFNGDDVERDWVKAYAWMTLAEEGELPEATSARMDMSEYVSRDEIAAARALAPTLVANEWSPETEIPDSLIKLAEAERDANAQRFVQNAASIGGTQIAQVRQAPAETRVAPAAAGPSRPTAPEPSKSEPLISEAKVSELPANAAGTIDAAPVPTPQAAAGSTANDVAQSAAPEDASSSNINPRPMADEGPGLTGVADNWRLQIGSFRNRENADVEWDRLVGRMGEAFAGLSPFIASADVNGTTYYRLQAGPFAEKADANEVCDALKAAGGSCYAKRVP